MTTLQAIFGQAARRTSKAGDLGWFWPIARPTIGAVVLAILVVAGLALRVLVYVRLP
jgi:hypothetical protein